MTEQSPRRLGVVARERQQALDGLLDEVRRAAEERGMEVSFERAIADYAPGSPAFDLDAEPVDMILSLGGDGTLLRAARMVMPYQVPVLGINLGDLGFLTSAAEEEIESVLDRLVAGDYFLDHRVTLKAWVLDEHEGELDVHHALNDFTVHKAAVAARVTRLNMWVEGGGRREEIGSFSGDGLILASPTGSTAYSLAAGGPIVHPTMECMVVTPICPHTLAVRPLVVPASRKVTVRAADPDQDLILTVDGQEVRALGSGEAVRVERGDQEIQLVRFHGQSFFATLRKKLSWAVRSGDGG